jgi:hypothetical protein
MADICDTAMTFRVYWKTEEIFTSRELLCVMEQVVIVFVGDQGNN